MKRKIGLVALMCCLVFIGFAQKKNFTYKFYGQIRGDLFYNSRANGEIADGLFHIYPLDHSYDADGKDLNAQTNSSFYMLYTRLGLDLTGPNIGKATTSAKLEADFRGTGTSFAVPRIRHAYLNLAWGKGQSFLVGQTWHPFFGDVHPEMLNLSTGAPFNAFSRAPQIRYRYTGKHWQFTATALWQLQYLAEGPTGKSEAYQKNSGIPEFHSGIDYLNGSFIAGIGADILSLVPRTKNTIGDKTYKLDERITSVSFEAHAQYKLPDWTFAAKSTLASNMTHTCMLGGYGITNINPRTGEQDYTPFRHSTTWLNIIHGSKWKQDLYIGYVKNLGTSKDIVGSYGTALDIDQMVTVNAQISYNLTHWKVGVEYSPATAWYGTADERGRVRDTHTVTNHRILWVMMYIF